MLVISHAEATDYSFSLKNIIISIELYRKRPNRSKKIEAKKYRNVIP